MTQEQPTSWGMGEGGGREEQEGEEKDQPTCFLSVVSYHLGVSELSQLWGLPLQGTGKFWQSQPGLGPLSVQLLENTRNENPPPFSFLSGSHFPRSWVASEGTTFWLKAWYTSLSVSSGLEEPCPGCSLPRFLKLPEEEALPGKNNAHTMSSLRLERKAEGTGSTFPAGHSTRLCSRKNKSKQHCQGSLRPQPHSFPPAPANHSQQSRPSRRRPPPSRQNPSSLLTCGNFLLI